MEVKKEWFCDRCFRPIRRVEDGWVQWWSTGNPPNGRGERLQLVHHKSASPLKNSDCGCCFHPNSPLSRSGYTVEDLPLRYFVGHEGLMRLFNLLEEEGLPQDEVLEMCKRLHIPGYERVRSAR